MESLTLEEAYYIGELIAAFVVIVSVIYLALQVKQNTKAIRLSNGQALSANLNPLMDIISANADVADLYKRGCISYESLDETEQVRFRTLAMHFHRVFNEAYEQMREGAVRDGTWESWSTIFGDLMKYPGFQSVWLMRRHWFEKTFREFVDELIPNSKSDA